MHLHPGLIIAPPRVGAGPLNLEHHGSLGPSPIRKFLVGAMRSPLRVDLHGKIASDRKVVTDLAGFGAIPPAADRSILANFSPKKSPGEIHSPGLIPATA